MWRSRMFSKSICSKILIFFFGIVNRGLLSCLISKLCSQLSPKEHGWKQYIGVKMCGPVLTHWARVGETTQALLRARRGVHICNPTREAQTGRLWVPGQRRLQRKRTDNQEQFVYCKSCCKGVCQPQVRGKAVPRSDCSHPLIVFIKNYGSTHSAHWCTWLGQHHQWHCEPLAKIWGIRAQCACHLTP